MTNPKPPHSLRIAAGFGLAFGTLTIVSGGMALWGGGDMGAVVPWVLWFNFGAGFAYVAAGAGLWQGRRWGLPLAIGIVAATVTVGIAFAVHVAQGGAYEPRTAAALVFRAVAWAAIVAVALRAKPVAGR